MPSTPPRRPPGTLIRFAIANPTVRAVLGSLSASDMEVLSKAIDQGELGAVVNPILTADDPKRAADAAATATRHPVAQVMSKIPKRHLAALAASCRGGCPG